MSISNDRVMMLEKVIQVMQSEMSQVLGEMQNTILALAKTNQITTQVITDRLDFIETKLGLKFIDDEPKVPETPAE